VVEVSKGLHSYGGQQDEKGIYLRGQMSARVRKGLIGVRLGRGMYIYGIGFEASAWL